jgi:hypothetical protein
MNVPRQYFTPCQPTESGAQLVAGQWYAFHDKGCLSLWLTEIGECSASHREAEALREENQNLEEAMSEADGRAEEAEEEVEKLREELETAKARIAELEGQVK